MKLTRSQCALIRKAAASWVKYFHSVEVGFRSDGSDTYTPNVYRWIDHGDFADADLYKLHELVGREIATNEDGVVLLDLYVWDKAEGIPQLNTNVYCLIKSDGTYELTACVPVR